MKKQNIKNNKKKSLKKSPIFLIALFNFLIIILIAIYIIYLRFIPYQIITYDGFAVSGKDLVSNLLNSSFDVEQSVQALEVKDQDEIFQNLKSFYIGADKKKEINLNYPIYVNDTLALYNLSSDVQLITDSLHEIEGYSGFTLTEGALYNANTLERADYHDYILMKNKDGMYINTKEIKIETSNNKYTIKMNSIINFTDEFITYYSLEDGNFVYGKILDIEMDSKLKIKDFNKEYIYKDFLIALSIIKEETKVEETEENVVEEEKEQIQEEENNTQLEENIIQNENNQQDNQTQEEEINKPDNDKVKWQKPEVTCSNFNANVYTATTEVEIYDPSKAIYKAVTFSFYINDEIQFRSSTRTSGSLKVTKLLPETTYHVRGTYQYANQNGSIIEVEFLKQDFTTSSAKNINAIELGFKNGQIYPSKIEIDELCIKSNIEDEAIYGVERAEIELNGVAYSINTSFLRSILKGNIITYQCTDGIESSKKYKYEFVFYDTAGNKMNLKNNTGDTRTSKSIPKVSVKIQSQNIISLSLGLELNNQDNVEINNYRYEMYSSDGNLFKREKLELSTKSLFFDNLDPNYVYNIRIYGDFDIEDGLGLKKNQEIGNYTFSTLSLSQLGSLKLEVNYDKKDDLTAHGIKFKVKIINDKTDSRLLKILKEVTISIKDENEKNIKEFKITDIEDFDINGKECELNNLNSNTIYTIDIKAVASQGSVEQEIATSFTNKNFHTDKEAATLNIRNVVITHNVIDFDIKPYDKDGASLTGDYRIELRNVEGAIIKEEKIDANKWTRCTFSGLQGGFKEENQGKEYTVKCFAQQYKESNIEEENIISNQPIGDEQIYKTEGLGGTLDLLEIKRKKNNDSKNLINVESEINWYSKCFDVLENNYYFDEFNNKKLEIISTNNYGKSYNRTKKELSLTANQCYVYDFREYKGQDVTISFKIKSSKDTVQAFIQKGKLIGQNTTQIENINTNEYITYVQTVTIPQDGYLGFYIKDIDKNGKINIESQEKVVIENLQVEKGKIEDVEYQPYQGILNSKIRINFEDIDYKNNGAEQPECYIRFNGNEEFCDKTEKTENDYKIEQVEQYTIEESQEQTIYKIELIIKKNERKYILDELSFEYNPGENNEIKSISSNEEYKEIQPNGKYILLSNLDLRDEKTESEYTFGNPKIAFNGKIDFNGKTIKKDTSMDTKKNTSYMFYNISNKSTLKNIVLDFYLNNNQILYDIDIRDGLYGLFLTNQGNINNIMLNLKGCTNNEQRYIGLVGYDNKGTIDKFIINFEKILYGTQYISGVCLESSGTIKSGYMYGAGIEVISNVTTKDSRHVGGIVYNLKSGGLVKKVYNLAPIKINHWSGTKSYAANIVYNVNSGATVKNVYSVPEIISKYKELENYVLYDENNKAVNNIGPNIVESSGSINDSYYFSGVYQGNTYNIKEERSKLHNTTFQGNMLNDTEDAAFIIDENVLDNKYPKLTLNSCMPAQASNLIGGKGSNTVELKIDLLEAYRVSDSETTQKNIKNYNDLIGKEDFNARETIQSRLDTIAKENGTNDFWSLENYYLVYFEVYNPSKINITEIDFDYVDVEIIRQRKVNNNPITVVYAVLSNPSVYINDYNITSVKGEILGGEILEDNDINNKINAPCYKHIKNAEDWINIYETNEETGVSGLIQNYILDNDIDFAGYENFTIQNSTFTGSIEGLEQNKEYTLSNINVQHPMFSNLKTSLKNLKVVNCKIETEDEYVGLIGVLESSGSIDNITIENIEIRTTGQNVSIGAACGKVNKSGTIKNINVTGVTIDTENRLNSSIGGIFGHVATSSTIESCSIEGLTINIGNTANKDGRTYVGGLCGKISSSNNIIDLVSVKDFKLTFSPYTEGEEESRLEASDIGGICGGITNSSEGTVNIKNSYTKDFDIENFNEGLDKVHTIGGILGHNYMYGTKINNCFVQGINFNIANGNIKGIGGILGRGTGEILVEYCYTTGDITTYRDYTGGIYGLLSKTSTVQYCYSLMNISGKNNDVNFAEYIGGIGGYHYDDFEDLNDTNNGFTKHNLFVGNIILPNVKVSPFTNYTKRIVGNQEYTYDVFYNNYAYKEQGMGIIGTKSDLVLGAKLLEKSQLFDKEETYINTNMLGFGEDYYNYNDFSAEPKGFPKINIDKDKTSDGYSKINGLFIDAQDNNLLSEDNGTWDYGVDLKKWSTNYVQYKNNGYNNVSSAALYTEEDINKEDGYIRTKIVLTIQNRGNAPITDVIISDMEITDAPWIGYEETMPWVSDDKPNISGKNWQVKKDGDNTVITIYAKPIKYKDSYNLTHINYKRVDGTEAEMELETPKTISRAYYRTINSEEEWNEKTSEDFENYIVREDLDFTNITANSNVNIRTLRSGKINSDNQPERITISNITLESTVLINQIKNLENINFENIKITNANGVVNEAINSGIIQNCDFRGIEITYSGDLPTGIIGKATSVKSINNINLTTVKVEGKTKVGSLCGDKVTGNVKNINATDIHVKATEDYVGGLFGQSKNGTMEEIQIYDPTQDSSPDQEKVRNYNIVNSIEGRSYVGGYIGYISKNYKSENITVSFTKIKGNRKYIAGGVGNSAGSCINMTSSFNEIIVENDDIITDNKGKQEYCTYIGGIVGKITGRDCHDMNSNNNTIVIDVATGNTNYIGGNIGHIHSNIENQYNINSRYNKIISMNKSNITSVGGCVGTISKSNYNDSKTQTLYSESNIIKADYGIMSRVGGCIGYTGNSSDNLITKYNEIKGTTHIGGCIGEANNNLNSNLTSTDNKITGKSQYVGGCIGTTKKGECKILRSNLNEISGTYDVGGCIGNSGAKNEDFISEGNLISITNYGTDTGGCIGKTTGISEKIQSIDTIVNGQNFVGGCIGSTTAQIINAKVYYTETSLEPTISAKYYNVGGIVGSSDYYNSSSSTTDFTINGAYVYNANIKGQMRVGGVAGRTKGSVYATAVDKSIVTANSNNAGGIIGEYIPYEGEDPNLYNEKSNYYISHSFCTNSTITTKENAGGLAGYFEFGDIQYCYVANSMVEATQHNAGGLVGYLANSNMNKTQYIYKMRYNSVVNTIDSNTINGSSRTYHVKSKSGVGGLIGRIEKNIESGYIESNLVVANLSSGNNCVSSGIGEQGNGNEGIGQYDNMENLYVYENSIIYDGESNRQIKYIDVPDGEFYYNVLNVDELSDANTYNGGKLSFQDSLNRYSFRDGYFPKLNEPYQTINNETLSSMWSEEKLNVKQDDILVQQDQSLQSEALNLSLLSLQDSLSIENELPEVYEYAVDVNKINIEFNTLNPNTYFEVKSNDKVIVEYTPITERVYSFEYDFETDFTITVSNLDTWYKKEVKADELRNLLDIREDEYIYLSNSSIYSNKKQIQGQFLNIYEGKALSSDGEIYDLSNMKIIDKLNNTLKIIDNNIPITETEYNGMKIQTFYHCSKVLNGNDYSYKDQQIFVKNGLMYIIDGELEGIGDSIIIDSYNDKQYQTILGTDGVVYDLLTKINYPNGFRNENIIDMTTNINSNENVVLVYYQNGKVYGFNYITGQEVYSNNVEEEPVGLVSYAISNFKQKPLLYNIEKDSYSEAQDLAEKLEHTSIEQALIKIDLGNNDNENHVENTIENDVMENQSHNDEQANRIQPQYITTYDVSTQKYVVYSTMELMNSSMTVESENEKINEDQNLMSFYANLSTSKINLKQIGIILFITVITLIGVILIALYRKNLRKIGR